LISTEWDAEADCAVASVAAVGVVEEALLDPDAVVVDCAL
jgi:hypothetical protein